MRGALGWVSWWVVMGGFLGATWWLSGDGRPDAALVAAMTIVNAVFLVGAEQLLPREPGTNLLRDRQSLNDIAHGVLFQFGGRPLAQAIAAGGVTWVAARGVGVASLWPSAWPFLGQVVVAILIWSFLAYWYHRALHTFRGLWWFHAIHHDTRQMHLLKSGRLHFGEEMMQFFIVPIPFLLMDVGPGVMASVALWNVYDGNLVHTNRDQRFPSFMHWFWPTVQNHYLHHAEARPLQDSNYGSFPFWDVLFGTYRHPDRNPVLATGIENDPVPGGFVAQVLYPFRALLGPEAASEAQRRVVQR